MSEHTSDLSVGPPAAGSPTGWDPEAGRWIHGTLRRAVEHGVRLYNPGEYHAAHDCFEKVWPSVNKSNGQGTGFERAATSL